MRKQWGQVKVVALSGKQWIAAPQRTSRWYNLETSFKVMSFKGVALTIKRKSKSSLPPTTRRMGRLENQLPIREGGWGNSQVMIRKVGGSIQRRVQGLLGFCLCEIMSSKDHVGGFG